jgi:hypothetical protein
VVAVPGVHPVQLPKVRVHAAKLHHLSWSQIRTEALMEQANKSQSATLTRHGFSPNSFAIWNILDLVRSISTIWEHPGCMSATVLAPERCIRKTKPLPKWPVTVPAPREGRPTTRVNWLVRQLKSAPGQAMHTGLRRLAAWPWTGQNLG